MASDLYKRLNRIRRKPFLLAANLFFVSTILMLFYEVTVIGRQKFQDIIEEAVTKPRAVVKGMHPTLEYYYRRKPFFGCLYTKELIAYDRINDDYCDCADGTDEPGTNACSDYFFFCDVENEDEHFHVEHVILSSRVNDGVCDCCDGSDEYSYRLFNYSMTPALVKCPFKC